LPSYAATYTDPAQEVLTAMLAHTGYQLHTQVFVLLALGIGLGWLVHDLADWPNGKPIAYFAPFSRRGYCGNLISVDKSAEKLLCTLIWCAIIAYLAMTYLGVTR
jgi:hypothetical protein